MPPGLFLVNLLHNLLATLNTCHSFMPNQTIGPIYLSGHQPGECQMFYGTTIPIVFGHWPDWLGPMGIVVHEHQVGLTLVTTDLVQYCLL